MGKRYKREKKDEAKENARPNGAMVGGERGKPHPFKIERVRQSNRRLLELGVFGLGLFEDGEVGVGVFPCGEELVGGGRLCGSRRERRRGRGRAQGGNPPVTTFPSSFELVCADPFFEPEMPRRVCRSVKLKLPTVLDRIL